MQQKYIDAGRQREFAGFSIFVSQRNPRYEESLRCAKAIGEALVAAGEKPSLYHAEPIAGENRPLLDRRLGVHRFDGLAVLKTATMPAVLVEAGVIVNRRRGTGGAARHHRTHGARDRRWRARLPGWLARIARVRPGGWRCRAGWIKSRFKRRALRAGQWTSAKRGVARMVCAT